ncbi:nucleotidyltransferase family protein [Celeribacter sp.]|uniref:nucleotidyltransferase family protein n=1 Tax=Celeribacter sp. TaxID=1890673 RepID=UPI003A93BB3E
MRVLAGIAAAGAAHRAGFDKLATPIARDGSDTLLSRVLFAAAGLDILVALPPRNTPYHAGRRAIIEPLPHVEVPERNGMSGSLKALARAALDGGYDGLLVMLADMPDIGAGDIAKLLRVFSDFGGARIVRGATEDGHAGHPILFPAPLLVEFAALSGDQGARAIVEAHKAKLVVLDGNAALRDVDTRADFDAL